MHILLTVVLFVFAEQSPVQPPTPSKSPQEKQQVSESKDDKSNNNNAPSQRPSPVQKNDTPPHERGADNRSNHECEPPSTDWITLFTGILAAVAALQFIAIGLQVHYMRKGLKETTKTAEAAIKSAKAAWQGIEVTISKGRARLKICIEKIDPQSQRPDGQIPLNGAVCWLMNYGLSTAFVGDFRGRFCQSDAPDIAAEYAQCKQVMHTESIPSNESSPKFLFLLEPSPTLADDDLLKIRTKKSFLHFYGFVKYRDVFELAWQTTIHMRWKVRWGGVIEGTVMDYWESAGPREENEERREKNTT